MSTPIYLNPLSPELGYPWLPTITREQWDTGFDEARKVLDSIGAKKGDERITLSFRNDGQKRFAVICGLKFISGFYQQKEEVWMRFYIGEQYDISPYPTLHGSDYEFKDGTSLTYAKMNEIDQLPDQFRDDSTAALQSFAAISGKSRFLKNHLDWLWDVIYNPDARNEFLAYIESKPEERILMAYKARFAQDHGADEWYKWQLTQDFQKNWNLDADDFGEMLRNLDFGNLLDNRAASFIKEAAKHPDEARAYFAFCMDESIPEAERIAGCKTQSAELLKKWRPEWSTSGQDERTLAVLWALRDPGRHILYKASFYILLCRYLGINPKKAGGRYLHYRSLMERLIAEHIETDQEWMELYRSHLPEKYADVDTRNFLLGQTVVYVVFDQLWSKTKEEEEIDPASNTLEERAAPSPEPMEPTEKAPLNLILYGPPGTGKTYELKNTHFENYTSRETSISPERHFENVAAELSWWQAIALALLELKEAKVAEIKENRWVKSKTENSQSKNINATVWGSLQTHALEESSSVNYKHRLAPLIFDKDQKSRWRILEDQVKEQAPELMELLDSVNNFKPDPDKVIERYVFTTFHQSFAYEDFIEGIKPVISDASEASELAYEIAPGVFKKLCELAAKDPEHRYAIFIDEINRGNVANIFGELITLIEPDKRRGAQNALSVQLPYSKTKFSVPANMDIIGTMNTADRSVEALDTALRRRFSFREMKPEPARIDEVLGGRATWEGVSLSEVLSAINARIETLIDRDHAIGHSYFLELKEAAHIESALKTIFFNKIVPLLQEYFYNDYTKIGMVLGKGFVKVEEAEVRFADFESDLAGDYGNGGRSSLISKEEIDLKQALKALLNKKETAQANG